MLLVALLVVTGPAAAAGAPLLEARAISRDRRIGWTPAPYAWLRPADGSQPRRPGGGSTVLWPGDELELHQEAPEQLESLRRLGELPSAAVLRVEWAGPAESGPRVFRFDPSDPGQAYVQEAPAWEEGPRRHYVPPPFPGPVSWMLKAGPKAPASGLEVRCAVARVRHRRMQWEKIEEAGRAAFRGGLGPEPALRALLTREDHDAAPFAWRQLAALPWPPAEPMPAAERELRRASFFLGALEARAGDPGVMDAFPAATSVVPLARTTAETPGWLAAAMTQPAASPAAEIVTAANPVAISPVRVDDREFMRVPRGHALRVTATGPRMLRVVTRQVYPDDAGERIRSYRLDCGVDGSWTAQAIGFTVPDDDEGLKREPLGRPLGRERVEHFPVPPGPHELTVQPAAETLMRVELERERQGVGESAAEEATGALARCLAEDPPEQEASAAGSPPRASARRLLVRAAAARLSGRPQLASSTARLAREGVRQPDGLFLAAVAGFEADEAAASGDLERAVALQRGALLPMPANAASTPDLTTLALARDGRRRLARALAASGRHGEAAEVLAQVLTALPYDAETRQDRGRLLALANPSTTERAEAWQEVDRAWWLTRLDPRARAQADRLWSASSRWVRLPPASNLAGPAITLMLPAEPSAPRPQPTTGPWLVASNRWPSATAPVDPLAPERCFPLPRDPDPPLLYSPTPGRIPGALRIRFAPDDAGAVASALRRRPTVELELLCDGEPGRLLLPRPDSRGRRCWEAWIPVPAGSPRVRLRAGKGEGRWVAAVSERLARSPEPELPAPGPGLAAGPPSLEPALEAARLDAAALAAARAGLATPFEEAIDTTGSRQAATIEAVAVLTEALHGRAPVPAFLHLARARLLASLGERALAQADLRRVLERHDVSPEVRLAAREDNASVLAEAGYRREALTERLASLAAGRDHAAQRLAVGELFLASGDAAAALSVFGPLARVRPGDPLAAARLIQTLVLLGENRPDSRPELDPEALGVRVVSPELAYARAVARVAEGRLEEAARAFRAAAAGAPSGLARAALWRAEEVETALAAAPGLFSGSEERAERLAYLAETWTDRAREPDWEPPDAFSIVSYETALRTVAGGVPLLSPTYRVSPGHPLLLDLAGPGRARVTIRPDCRPMANGRPPRGSAAWRLEVDGRPAGAGRVDGVAPSAEVGHPEAPGLLPGQAETRFVELPAGPHRLSVSGAASSFGVRVSLQSAGYDDLLAPGGLLASRVPASAGALTGALRLQRSGRLAEARQALESAPACADPRRLLLLAQLRAALGDAAGSRAALAALPSELPPELSARAASLRLALAAGAPAGDALPWSDTLAALAQAETLLESEPGLPAAHEVRSEALVRLDWDDVPAVERAASAETLVTTGEVGPAPAAVLLRRALAYSPWGSARTMTLGRNRLRLELAAEGETALALEAWPERQPRGLEPPPPAGACARLSLRLDGRALQEWLAPLNRLSRLELPPLSPGGHVLELALDDPDGRGSAAVRVWLDRPVLSDGSRLGLGRAGGAGGWHPLEPRRVQRTFAATGREPVELALRGPAVVRVYGRHLAGPGMAPAPRLLATVSRPRGPSWSRRLELSARGDPAARLVDRTGVTAGIESFLQLSLPAAGEHRLVLAPPAGSAALVRLELPAPAAAPTVPATGPLSAEPATLAPGVALGPARPLDGPRDDLLAAGAARQGTIRYQLVYDENLRPENEDFRLDRKLIASVTSYRATWDGSESRAWQADRRLRVDGPPAHVLEHRYTRTTRRETGPRWRAAASAATQPVDGSEELALRGSAQVDWLRRDGPRVRHVPAVGLDLYAGTLHGPGQAPPAHVDPEVYTRFDRQHPAALYVQDTLTYSPHTDGEYFLRGRATTNASLRPDDLDRASLRLGTRQLRYPLEAEAAFTHTERLEDNHRSRRIRDDDLSFELSWSRWLTSGRFLVAALGAVYRNRFDEWLPGVAVTLTAPRGRGFDDLPPGATSFEGLKELEAP